MAQHCVIFYNKTTGAVKKIIPSYYFTNLPALDNMANHCEDPEDRLILGQILSDGQMAQQHLMKVHKNKNKHFITINDNIINIYNENTYKGKPIIIECDIFSGTGYGMLSREFMKRLLLKDLDIKINPINSAGLFSSCITDEEMKLYNRAFINTQELSQMGATTRMRIYPPKINFPRKHFSLTYTMIESYTLHHLYAKMVESSFDRIIVPTKFVKDVFSQHIDPQRIDIVPLGIDQEIFNPQIKQEDIHFKKVNLIEQTIDYTDEKPSGFRFLSAARFSHRKGCDLVLKAFANEFTKADDVSLVLFYLPENERDPEHLIKRILSILTQYTPDPGKLPNIYLKDTPWPTDKQHAPYGWGDCFVFPSRGEGFGLTPLEAGACKIPVIASNNSGLGDFISEDVAFVVPTDKVENIGTINFANGMYEGRHPEWTEDIFHPHTYECSFPIMFGEDTIKTIGYNMRFVYENPNSEIVQNKVENMYNLIHNKFTWDKATDALYNILKEIQND